MVVMVLHHLADPTRVLAEAARALRPKGKLLVLDMLSHDREDYHQQMGHVWLGFEPEQIQQWLDGGRRADCDACYRRPIRSWRGP